jgi:large subunit ribosomal protein L19
MTTNGNRQNVISSAPVSARESLDIRAGDTVRVWQKIKEADGKTRLQAFDGIVIAKKHGKEAGATFTVRKVMDGVGVEKIFPLYSPMIDKVEVIRRAKVRRAKLYFIREKAAKEIRRQMRRLLTIEPGQNTDTKLAIAEKVEEKESLTPTEASS